MFQLRQRAPLFSGKRITLYTTHLADILYKQRFSEGNLATTIAGSTICSPRGYSARHSYHKYI